VISPYSKKNFVDHSVIDQSSITRFIEDNWLGGQRITGSFDALAGTINSMLDFTSPSNSGEYLLDPLTGLVTTNNSK
jgi:phospholipase C